MIDEAFFGTAARAGKRRFRRRILNRLNHRFADEWEDVFQEALLVAWAKRAEVEEHTPLRWIERGWLKAEKVEGDKRECARWFIRHRQAFEFALGYPNEYDLAKVDKVWFLDLVTQGKAVWTDEYLPADRNRRAWEARRRNAAARNA